MTDSITEGVTADGLILKDYNTLLSELQDDFNAIYAQDGNPINFGSETPDGQLTNILTQRGVRQLTSKENTLASNKIKVFLSFPLT